MRFHIHPMHMILRPPLLRPQSPTRSLRCPPTLEVLLQPVQRGGEGKGVGGGADVGDEGVGGGGSLRRLCSSKCCICSISALSSRSLAAALLYSRFCISMSREKPSSLALASTPPQPPPASWDVWEIWEMARPRRSDSI